MKPTLSSVLQHHLDAFLDTHKLPQYQLVALKSYRACRTAALGTHSQYCENGHLMGVWYSSCKRRGCAQCQSLSNARWLAAQKERLLQVTHHHWIFTLPHDLLPLWRYNRALLQDLLFKAVADTLSTLSRDPKFLNAQPGYLLTLHTWGRNLSLHPHIHCLISHGGLDQSDQWVDPKKSCLFPAQVMMRLFRGKFLAALRECDDLVLPDDLSTPKVRTLINRLGRTEWVVHCCKPYRHGAGVVSYLSRYVRSGPISNRQFRYMDEDRVVFGYHNHRTSRQSRLNVPPAQFILRLCDHIPQRGKPTIRYYGLYHACRRTTLNKARETRSQKPVRIITPATWQEYLQRLDRVPECPQCGAKLRELVPS
jgi:hypothetical protein